MYIDKENLYPNRAGLGKRKMIAKQKERKCKTERKNKTIRIDNITECMNCHSCQCIILFCAIALYGPILHYMVPYCIIFPYIALFAQCH